MATRHYHAPIPKISTRPRCPVCDATVYSLAGIHPQCAVRQADPPRPRARPVKAATPDGPPALSREPACVKVVADRSPRSSRSACE